MLRQKINVLTIFGAMLVMMASLGVTVSTSDAALINLTPTSGVNSNTSVPLGDLIANDDSIAVGDKIFSGFNYSRIGDMPQAADVNVLGFRDPSGNWGLSFHGAFVDLPGGGFSDALIRFIVDIDPAFLQQGYRISDAHLFLGGVGVGANSALIVDESFLESNETMSVFRSTINQGGSQLSDWVYFDPVHTRLHVTKDIFALADNNANLPARATVIDQSFSQVIPEPATVALLAISAVAAIGFSNRRNGRPRIAR